jgi:hypothetical protein
VVQSFTEENVMFFFKCCQKTSSPGGTQFSSSNSSNPLSHANSPTRSNRVRSISSSTSRKSSNGDAKELQADPPSFCYTVYKDLETNRNNFYPNFRTKLLAIAKNSELFTTHWQTMLSYRLNNKILNSLRHPNIKPESESKEITAVRHPKPELEPESEKMKAFAKMLLTLALCDIEYHVRYLSSPEIKATDHKQSATLLVGEPGAEGGEKVIYEQITTNFTTEKKEKPGTLQFVQQNKGSILRYIYNDQAYPNETRIIFNQILNLYIDQILFGIISDNRSYLNRNLEIIQQQETETSCCCFPSIKRFFQSTPADPSDIARLSVNDGLGAVPPLIPLSPVPVFR